MRQFFVLARVTDAGDKVYVTHHRKADDFYSGFDVGTTKEPAKALLFSREKNAQLRVKELSSDLEAYFVETYTPTAKIGDMVDESGEVEIATGRE